jgi:hypothetical protein
MKTPRHNILHLAAIAACITFFAWQARALAQREESSLLLSQPTNEIAAPAPPEAAPEAPLPAAPMTAAPAAVEYSPAPCISYRTHFAARRMLRCQRQVEMMMTVDNPADCDRCTVNVPLCIPCCCTGAPSVQSDCSLLGRGTVQYCWDCGFRATVVFRARGDIVVHYGA